MLIEKFGQERFFYSFTAQQPHCAPIITLINLHLPRGTLVTLYTSSKGHKFDIQSPFLMSAFLTPYFFESFSSR
jgi:hypothetical protein